MTRVHSQGVGVAKAYFTRLRLGAVRVQCAVLAFGIISQFIRMFHWALQVVALHRAQRLLSTPAFKVLRLRKLMSQANQASWSLHLPQ